jgi:hypothetical protein
VFPDARGLVGSIDLSVPAGPSTRLKILADRDLEYSYEEGYPIYLVASLGGSVMQRVGRWEFEAGGSRQKLTYRTSVLDISRSSRADTGNYYRAHVRYRISRHLRTMLNSEYLRRNSLVQHRRSEGLRLGVSLEAHFTP